MSQYLADTTVIIELLRGNREAKDFLEKQPYISTITVAELIQGSRNKDELQIVEKTCELFSQIKIDQAISKLAIEFLSTYYLSHGLLFLDALIAASCLVSKKTLVTDNVKDFIFIKDLKILSHKKVF